MSEGFFARLEARARQIDSLLCVGLDPQPADLAEPTAQAALDFCLRMIEATAELALAYKPNAAFFEVFGAEGWAALKQVIRAASREAPVVLDAKRGDIASTAEAYARAVFEELGAQALTASPYLGYDSLQPFLSDSRRGVFLLCKTSNPGSLDLQDLALAGEGRPLRLYEKVALLAQEWNERGNLGLVVGATHPEALARVRELTPELWMLAPGVGAQGGDLAAALQAGLRADGLGLLVPVSRALSRSGDARQAAFELVEAMRAARRVRAAQPAMDKVEKYTFPPELAEGLLSCGCVRFGQFTLKSGVVSPIYIDLRNLASHPDMLAQAASAYLPILEKLHFDRLAAIPYAALPIGAAISLQSGWPLVYPRKEVKAYGTRVEVEGEFHAGETAVLIDDLATTGGSKCEAAEKLRAAGLQVQDVVVLIDRQSGAAESLAQGGLRLHATVRLSDLLDTWEQGGSVAAAQIEAAREFLRHG